jgi:protease-4
VRFEGALDFQTAAELTKLAEKAREDPKVAGVVLELLSPGGLATSSEAVFYSLLRLRETKPLMVVVDGLAVSGGYYVAVAGNQIYAPSSSYVGNVGTRGPRPPDPEISPDELSSGPFKLAGGGRFDRIQQLALIRDAFVGNVVHQRAHAEVNPLKIDADTVAEARIYLGSEAVAVGLIDLEGGRSDAIQSAAEAAGVQRYSVVDLFDYFDMGAETNASLEESVREMAQHAPPDAVFLLDSRFPLPGVDDDSELERRLLWLRSVDPGSLSATQRSATFDIPADLPYGPAGE